MIQERVALVLRVRKEDLCWRLLGREAPKIGGWAECEWVEGRVYPALAIHFAAPDAAAAPRRADSRPCTETLRNKEGWQAQRNFGFMYSLNNDTIPSIYH